MPKKKTRKKHVKTEYKEQREKHRSKTSRHVLVVELDADEPTKRKMFKMAESLWESGNHLTNIMQKCLDQYYRRRDVRKLQLEYKKAAEADDTAKKKEIGSQMSELQKQMGLTKTACADFMSEEAKRKGLPSVFCKTRGEDIWAGVEKVLFRGSKHLHYRRKGDYPLLRAQQPKSCIIFGVSEGNLTIAVEDDIMRPITKDGDIFMQEEMAAVIAFQQDPKAEENAVAAYIKSKVPQDTFRICYGAIDCQWIRKKRRLFLHITIEGRAKPKKKKDGTPRHTYGTGRMGVDMGTQSYAAVSQGHVVLDNLAERNGVSTKVTEAKEAELQRRMEDSRRASNPQNYNADGTVRKGRKKWKKSKHYLALLHRLQEIRRKNALSRKYAVQEEVNQLRQYADEIIIEPKSAAEWAKTTEIVVGEDGVKRESHHPSYGSSIQNRCPGLFQAELKKKFPKYHEVDKDFRASQYDHTDNSYEEKPISRRWFVLSDGTKVQRDLYSAFLMFCSDNKFKEADRNLCIAAFQHFLEQHNQLVEALKNSTHAVLNSGIKPLAA